MATILSADDLDGLGADAMAADDPRPVRAELLDAVDAGRLADPAETGYALRLAAEISERCGDDADALAISTRAVAVADEAGDQPWIRGAHAGLLLRLGHAEDGMRELTALRPLLTRDPFATTYVIDELREHGRVELAEQWLTAALTTATERAERCEEADPGSEEAMDAWEIADALGSTRAVVRRDLGLPPDEADELAAHLDQLDEDTPDLLFWPEPLFASARAAELGDDLLVGATWDAHRAAIEQELRAGDDAGEPLLVEVATPALLVSLTGNGADDPDPGALLEWPPGRNDPCWCGSAVKYKKCCLPRGRG